MMRNIQTREGYEFWDKLNALPRYAFLLSPSGKSVQKFEDQTMGNWIDVHEAQKVVDQAQDEINQFRAERDALQQRLTAADQRIDELTAPVPSDPVRWGAPKTVRQLIHQLSTLDPDLEPWAMHRIPDFKDGKQVAAVHLSVSYERVDGRFLSDFKGDGRKILAFWCKNDPRAEHPTLVAEKLVTRLAEEFPDSETMLTVECVADLITEYLTGL